MADLQARLGRALGGGSETIRVKIEHAAYQVGDPVALARWYVDHLGMTVKRAQTTSPFGHFLADDGDAVMLEFYANPRVQIPDYRAMDPTLFHPAPRRRTPPLLAMLLSPPGRRLKAT